MKKILIFFLFIGLLCAPFHCFASVDWEIKHFFTTEHSPIDIAYAAEDGLYFVLTKGGTLYIYSEKGKQKGKIPVDPAMNRIAVSAQGDKVILSSEQHKTVQEISITFQVNIGTEGAPFLGPADAPVTLVVFSDFQCTYCAQAGKMFEQVLERYPEQVKIVFKHFPLQFHKVARPAALAALAAQEQGKFWEFHDLLFKNVSSLTEEKIQGIAKELHLDMKRFQDDLDSPAIRQKLSKDLQDAVSAGVKGTPTLFVNGRLVKKRSSVADIIREELAKTNHTTKSPTPVVAH